MALLGPYATEAEAITACNGEPVCVCYTILGQESIVTCETIYGGSPNSGDWEVVATFDDPTWTVYFTDGTHQTTPFVFDGWLDTTSINAVHATECRFSCVDENCNYDAEGPYTTANCDGECAQTYVCDGGSCILQAGGPFNSLGECEAACGPCDDVEGSLYLTVNSCPNDNIVATGVTMTRSGVEGAPHWSSGEIHEYACGTFGFWSFDVECDLDGWKWSVYDTSYFEAPFTPISINPFYAEIEYYPEPGHCCYPGPVTLTITE